MDNEYFVGWGTLALINAGLAQEKTKWSELVSDFPVIWSVGNPIYCGVE